jgi:hypothetical protein
MLFHASGCFVAVITKLLGIPQVSTSDGGLGIYSTFPQVDAMAHIFTHAANAVSA